MTSRDSGKEVLRQIIEGLEGVTPGKWCQFHPSFCKEAEGSAFSTWDTSHDLSAVRGTERRRIATFTHASDAAHVDRCHPDAMRAIAEYVAALEAERGELRAALEPFAHSDMEWDIHEDNVTVGSCDFTQGDLRRARAALQSKGDANG